MHSYAGNSSVYPATVGLVDDADLNPATASAIDTAPQNLADRTAWLNAHMLPLAGGTVTGTVIFSGGSASLHMTAGNPLFIDAGGHFTMLGIEDIETGASLRMQTGSTVSFDPGGAVTGVLVGNPVLELRGALIIQTAAVLDVNHAGGLYSSVADGITTFTPGGISSGVGGSLKFGASATDYGLLSPARNKSYAFLLRANNFHALDGTNWDEGNLGLIGQKSTQSITCRIENPHQGATLSIVQVAFVVVNPHPNVPAVFPKLSVKRLHLNFGSASTPEVLGSTDPQSFPNPGSGAAYYALGHMQSLDYGCDQNNVIDNVNYLYYIELTDENGANSIAGNFYTAMVCTYSAISDLRFPS